jgi:uroporphyrinogen decarboxylase
MAPHPMTSRQRLEACLSGAPTDRPPVSLWRHFPVDDQTPEGLAAATLDFQNAFQFDFVKVTPASSFCLKDWGAQDAWQGASEGTRSYTRRVIHSPEDWRKLKPLDPNQGYLGAQLACLRLLAVALRSQQVPLVQTIFNPLSQAKNLVGAEKLQLHLRLYPEAVHAGLQTIVETTRRFIEAALQTGIDGIFYAVQHASYRLLSKDEYLTFGKTYDLQVLEAARSLWLNILHLHGEDVMFRLIADYPVQVMNWHDRDTAPSLAQGKRRFQGVVCGGLQRETSMVLGTPEQVTAEALDAIHTTHGERFILGTGCVVPIIAPRANLLAARRSVEKPLPGVA